MAAVIGIDFGTNNTLVEVYSPAKNKYMPLRYDKEDIIPTVICFESEAEYLIGNKAKKRLAEYPNATLSEFKTKVAERKAWEIEAISGERFKLKPFAIAQKFLEKLKDGITPRIVQEFGTAEMKAVVTVPAGFTPTQKEMIKRAATSAGFIDVRLVAEPTAAARASQEDELDELNTILVYDFGGGTFDVSLLQKDNAVYKEIDKQGNPKLGGNDLTRDLAKYLMSKIEEQFGYNLDQDLDDLDEDDYDSKEFAKNKRLVLEEAEENKCELSEEETTEIVLPLILHGESHNFEYELTRKEFEDVIRPKIESTLDFTENVLEASLARGITELDRIVLAGGSARIPLVRELFEERMPEHEIHEGDDLDKLIARGAAILAQSLDTIDTLTEAITSHSYGIKSDEGLTFGAYTELIPVNVRLPYAAETVKYLNGRENISIELYQHDIKQYPNAKTTADEGIEFVDKITINLPTQLDLTEAKARIKVVAESDGSLSLTAKLTDSQDQLIVAEQELSIIKESELE